MSERQPDKRMKSLYTTALINVVVWACAMIALTILLQKGGNLKGMFVILAAGTAVGVQLIALISGSKKE